MHKRITLSLPVLFLLIMGTADAFSNSEAPVIEGESIIYVSIPDPDSLRLNVSNEPVENWYIDTRGKYGTVSLHQTGDHEAWVIYAPLCNDYKIDTIIIGAEALNGKKETKSITVYNYDNPYQHAGEKLLDKIIEDFFYSQSALYAEKIDKFGNLIQPISFLWPASHLLRAFKNGYRQNKDKYLSRLRNYSISLDKYLSDASGKFGYAAFPGENQRFYDDNGLLIIQFSEIHNLLEDNRILARAKWVYDFCNNDRDANWGLPQHESELGQGMFYSMAVNQTGLGAAQLYDITGESTYLEEAISYYTQMNNPEVLLKDPAWHLFHQYTFYQNGEWSLTGILNGEQKNGAGFRAYQTTHVIQLAIRLYKITGEQHYLDEAVLMTDKSLSYWYRDNQGLNENAFWGGDDMIDALIDMYYYTGDQRYLTVSKDIIDYLIKYGQDALGYYPSDYNDAYGKWNLDRRNAEPATILMMGQAAAAAAMLRLAYAIENDPVVSVTEFPDHLITPDIIVYPNIVGGGQELNLKFSEPFPDKIKVGLFTIHGKKVQEKDVASVSGCSNFNFRLHNHAGGIYILVIQNGNTLTTRKLIFR